MSLSNYTVVALNTQYTSVHKVVEDYKSVESVNDVICVMCMIFH